MQSNILCFLFGSGFILGILKLCLENAVLKIVKPLLEEKQDCKMCILQHNTLNTRLDSIDKKLDILIEKGN